jgi:hypothetical protein
MKTLITLLAVIVLSLVPLEAPASTKAEPARKKISKVCNFKGKKLYGKVKLVKSFPNFKVKQVTSFPDLKVKKVTSFPNKCGKWKFVDNFPDFTVKWVNSFEDFSIEYVDSFPGVP